MRYIISVLYVRICAQWPSHVWLFVTPWAIAHHAPLPMSFPRQEYQSGLPCPPPGELPNPGIEPTSPALAGRFLITRPPGRPIVYCESESCSVISDSLWSLGLYSPCSSPGQNTRVGSWFLLQGIFPTQGLNLALPHCRWILYQLRREAQEYFFHICTYKLSNIFVVPFS